MTLVVDGIVVAVAAVLPAHLVGEVVVGIWPDLLWSHLMQYIPSLSADSTSFPSIYPSFYCGAECYLIPIFTV